MPDICRYCCKCFVTKACCACGGGVECTDSDNDGICDDEDSCPFDASNDADHDSICQNVDSCPLSQLNDCGTTSAIAAPSCPSEYELRKLYFEPNTRSRTNAKSSLQQCVVLLAPSLLICIATNYRYLGLVLESDESPDDVLQTSTLLNINDCALECESVAGCVGMQYSSQTLACVLLSTYEAATDSSSSSSSLDFSSAKYACILTASHKIEPRACLHV